MSDFLPAGNQRNPSGQNGSSSGPRQAAAGGTTGRGRGEEGTKEHRHANHARKDARLVENSRGVLARTSRLFGRAIAHKASKPPLQPAVSTSHPFLVHHDDGCDQGGALFYCSDVWVPGLHARLDRVLSTPPLFRLHPGLGAAATGCRPVIGNGAVSYSSLCIGRSGEVSRLAFQWVRASPGVSQLTIPLSKV